MTDSPTPWPICFRALTAAALIVTLVILAGCNTTQREVIDPQIVEVPPSLLECAPEPRLTAALAEKLRTGAASAADVAVFVNRLAASGADCRAKLAAVRRFLDDVR